MPMSQTRSVPRACNSCKSRRIKCDEERPICQRCLRSGRECSYAIDFDRVHRDETRRTQRRVVQGSSAAAAAAAATSAAIRGAAPTPGNTNASANARSQRDAARAAARHRTAAQPRPTTAASTIRLTPAVSSSASATTSASVSSSPSAPLLLPVRNSSSPGGSGTSADGNLNLASITGRGDGMPFIYSAPGTETTAFVAGHEVEHDVAQAAGVMAAGTGSRFFWRGQRTSPSTSYAHIYSPDDFTAGTRIGTSPFPPQTTPPGHTEYGENNNIRWNAGNDDIQCPASTLSLPIGELALCYFASNFMLMPRRPFGGSFFEFIVPVLRGQPTDSAVQYALRACAFSALGNRWVSETVDFHAIGISQYTAALARTTQSLKDPKLKTADATLAAVLLLGLFESITARKEMFAWRSHIEGAVQIVQNRGARKIRTRTEQLLFNSVRLQLIDHSMTADTPPTWNINWWSGESILDSASARSQRFLLEVSQLRRELERHVIACTGQMSIAPTEFSMYVLRVKAIDNEMASFLSSLPDNYKSYTLAIAGDVPGGDYENAETFPGRVDMYPDLTIAGIWVSIRACRLVMSCFIVRCMALTCRNTNYRTTLEYAEEVRRCSSLVTDVVAAVPYFLGSTPSFASAGTQSRIASGSVSVPSSGFACGDDHGHGLPKVLASYLLIWPLAGTFTHDCASPAQRAYMGGRLKYMGNTMGLRYALVCQATPFRYPSMMMYRDRLIVSGSPASSPPAASSSAGSPTVTSLPLVGLGRGPSSSRSPKSS